MTLIVWIIGLFFAGLVALGVFSIIESESNADTFNNNFTQHCNTLGGHAIITDKDLCISPNGLVLDYEH